MPLWRRAPSSRPAQQQGWLPRRQGRRGGGPSWARWVKMKRWFEKRKGTRGGEEVRSGGKVTLAAGAGASVVGVGWVRVTGNADDGDTRAWPSGTPPCSQQPASLRRARPPSLTRWVGWRRCEGRGPVHTAGGGGDVVSGGCRAGELRWQCGVSRNTRDATPSVVLVSMSATRGQQDTK